MLAAQGFEVVSLMCYRYRGMGGRGGIATKQAPAAADDSDAARKRFGNAKSISSSQYNSEDTGSRNDYEKEVRQKQHPLHPDCCACKCKHKHRRSL